MKKTTSLLLSLLLAMTATGQKKAKPAEAFYVMDKDFKGTSIENAVLLMHSLKQNDTSWQFDIYNMYGPMISSEHYKDEKGTILHGDAVYFNKNGTRDSIAHYANGYPDGSFYYFNDTGRVYLQKEFKNGAALETIDRIKKDSIDKEEWKRKNDTVGKAENESDFPGGVNGWIKFLTHNLNYPDRALKIQKQGTVVLQFIVDKDGHVLEPQIVKSIEFSLDEEALRIIRKSPLWSSAMQNGRKVKSYKKQPLTFRLQ